MQLKRDLWMGLLNERRTMHSDCELCRLALSPNSFYEFRQNASAASPESPLNLFCHRKAEEKTFALRKYSKFPSNANILAIVRFV